MGTQFGGFLVSRFLTPPKKTPSKQGRARTRTRTRTALMAAAVSFPCHHHRLLQLCPSSASSSFKPKSSRRSAVRTSNTPLIYSSLSDPLVLEIAEKLEDSLSPLSSPPAPPLVQKLRLISSQSILTKPWPSSKDEPFRFTDTTFLKHSQIQPVPPLSSFDIPNLSDTPHADLVFIDGHFVPSLSSISDLPEGVYAGSISGISDNDPLMVKLVNSHSNFSDGDLFWALNGIGSPDIFVIHVPAGFKIEKTLHLGFYSYQGGENFLPVSNPRLLVLVEKGGEIDIVEEYMGCTQNPYWTNSVMEVVIEDGGKVGHSYIQSQSHNAAHTKWTFVQQDSSSSYKLIETSTGGKLSRHNLHIQQLGPDTVTEFSTFHLSGSNQTQDLHSRLVLDHPRGYSRQLHKCIVASSSGQAIFDGNIKVNRHAQQTDAGQLTRSLLLAPRATVNVKPNLQIIADDVKCSHGATISDLEEDELFYFQARGVDIQTARNALVFSFGAEVMECLPGPAIRKRVESDVKGLLAARGALP